MVLMEEFKNPENLKKLIKIEEYSLSDADSVTFKENNITYYGTWHGMSTFSKFPTEKEIQDKFKEFNEPRISHYTVEKVKDGRYVVGFFSVITTAN